MSAIVPSMRLRFAFAVVILLGIFFRFYHLDRKVYWEDEIFGTIHALGYTEAQIVQRASRLHDAGSLQAYFRLPSPESNADRLGNTVLSLAAEDPQHPPAYYLLSHLWMQRFGSSVSAIRSLPAIFGVLVLPCVYWLALEVFASPTVALFMVSLVAVSPFHVLYAQEAREYSLWTVVIALSSALFLRALRLGTGTAWAGYSVALLASLYVFPFSALVAVGQGIWLAGSGEARRGRAIISYLVSCGTAAAGFLPWFWITIRSDALLRDLSGIVSTQSSIPEIGSALIRNVRQVFVDFGYHFGPIKSAPVNLSVAMITSALCVYSLYYLARHGKPKSSTFVFLTLCCFVVPFLLKDLSGHGRLIAQARYFTPLYLGIELAVAFLFSAKLCDSSLLPWQHRQWAGLVGASFAAGAVSCAIITQADTWWNKDYEQNRTIAGIVNAAAAPLVLTDYHTSRTLGLGYYLDKRVKLKLNLACDACGLNFKPRRNMFSHTERYSDVFLLGPSKELLEEVSRTPDHERYKTRYRIIDVEAYPAIRKPLSLFRAI